MDKELNPSEACVPTVILGDAAYNVDDETRENSPESGASIYAKLTPESVSARSAFDLVAREIRGRAQTDLGADRYMYINPVLVLAPDVATYRAREKKKKTARNDDNTTDDTGSPVAKDDLTIYTGHFVIDLTAAPTIPPNLKRFANPDLPCWILGRGSEGTHFKLCPPSWTDLSRAAALLRVEPEHGLLQIMLMKDTHYTFNGSQKSQKSQPTTLMESSTLLGFGELPTLGYTLKYEDANPTLSSLRSQLQDKVKGQEAYSTVDWLPTPTPMSHHIGGWNFGAAKGMGKMGQVYVVTRSGAAQTGGQKVAVIKDYLMYPELQLSIQKEVDTLRQIEQLARTNNCDHILRLREILPSEEAVDTRLRTLFTHVYLVLAPLMEETLKDYIRLEEPSPLRKQWLKGTLSGLAWMHSHGWVHRDMKPANIGVNKDGLAVLLDLGSARYLAPGQFLPVKPGTAGTVPYLAPEMEWDRHNWEVDMWSVGVIAFELQYGCYPFQTFGLTENAHRFDDDRMEKYATHRALIKDSYLKCMDRLSKDPEPINDLIIEMLRRGPRAPFPDREHDRITAKNALLHHVWNEDGVAATEQDQVPEEQEEYHEMDEMEEGLNDNVSGDADGRPAKRAKLVIPKTPS
jgi:serine/threonine protein kinase